MPNSSGSSQVVIGDDGILYAGIQVPWTITSDRRLKTKIASSDLGLAFIKNLSPVSYVRTNDKNSKTEYGFIAQEVDETLKNTGQTNSGMVSKDDAGIYSIRYNDLMAPMVKAIQEQQVLIENQKQEIDDLKIMVSHLSEKRGRRK